MGKSNYPDNLSSCFCDNNLKLSLKSDLRVEDIDTIDYSDKVEVCSADELRKLPQQPSLRVTMLDQKEQAHVMQRSEKVHDQIPNITINRGKGFLVGHLRTNSPVWASFITAEGDGKFVCDATHRAMIQFYVFEDGSWSTDVISLDDLGKVRPCEWVVGESVNERWVHIYDTMLGWAKSWCSERGSLYNPF
ncbi:hypothetical protein G6514_008524 [Epicoccum nigrum]|nr:hypothetical protein G6514_008524 [Epicoccum nigrum]